MKEIPTTRRYSRLTYRSSRPGPGQRIRGTRSTTTTFREPVFAFVADVAGAPAAGDAARDHRAGRCGTPIDSRMGNCRSAKRARQTSAAMPKSPRMMLGHQRVSCAFRKLAVPS